MSNNNKQNQGAREYFTLGEHAVGMKHYRFRYNGRTYRILEHTVTPDGVEGEETMLLEEADSRNAYDAWNRIKRPERFGL